MIISKKKINNITIIRKEFLDEIKSYTLKYYDYINIFQEMSKSITGLNLEEDYIFLQGCITNNIRRMNRKDFYVCLGEYFEGIYLEWYKNVPECDKESTWFRNRLTKYRLSIMKEL